MTSARGGSELSRRLVGAGIGVLGSTVLLALFSRMAVPWVVLGWVAMVPWLAVVERARSAWEALLLGLALSVTYSAAIFGWFPGALQAYSGAPAWWCWGLMLALSPVFQFQFLVAPVARFLARRSGAARGAWFAPGVGSLVYVGAEWVAPKLFADTLGHGLYGSELLRQGADVAGVPGLTLVLLLGNECVLAVLKGLASRGRLAGALRDRRVTVPVIGLASLVALLAGYGAVRSAQVRAATRSGQELVVGAVQANITHVEKLGAEMGRYEVTRMILDTHYAMSDSLMRAGALDLLVWPETVYPTTFGTPKSEAGAEFDADLSSYVSERGVPLVFGAYDLDGEREFNAAMFLTPGAAPGGPLTRAVYRKTMLFPLTEWVPDLIDSPALRESMPWTGRWKRGPGPRSVDFRLRDGRTLHVAPLICYEAIFPGYVASAVRQGAELILTLSNDSWFSHTPAPRLHLMHAAFRSIETRRPQVRVTNSGITALIDATGTVLSEVDDDQRAGVTLHVPATSSLTTLAVAWGDWLGPVALVLAAGLLVALRRSGGTGRR